MEIDEFWSLIECSAREADGQEERLRWLEDRLSRIPPSDVIDFQVQLEVARGPIDTYMMWGAADLITRGACSDDGFWYFHPWLIGLGRHWYSRAVAHPDNLADVPAVRALAELPSDKWRNADWPLWERLGYVAGRVYGRLTGQDYDVFLDLVHGDERSHTTPRLSDPEWDFRDPVECERRLPRLSRMFDEPVAG
jgi:hypothetical protein